MKLLLLVLVARLLRLVQQRKATRLRLTFEINVIHSLLVLKRLLTLVVELKDSTRDTLTLTTISSNNNVVQVFACTFLCNSRPSGKRLLHIFFERELWIENRQ